MQHIMWNMKIGMIFFSHVKVLDFLHFLLHSDVANVFDFAGIYLECTLNDALRFIAPTLNYKPRKGL